MVRVLQFVQNMISSIYFLSSQLKTHTHILQNNDLIAISLTLTLQMGLKLISLKPMVTETLSQFSSLQNPFIMAVCLWKKGRAIDERLDQHVLTTY